MEDEERCNNSKFVPVREEAILKASQETPQIRKHRLRLLHCPLCDYSTSNKILMAYHEESHSTEKMFSCDHCNYETLNKTEYVNHTKTHKLPKIKCALCSFKSASKFAMKRHALKHKKESNLNFTCSVCSFITDNEKLLKTHISIQHESAKYVSQAIKQEDCTRSCVNSGTNYFESAGPSNLNFTCSVCSFITDNEKLLKTHISSQHELESARYISQATEQDCTGSCMNSGTNNFESAGPSNFSFGCSVCNFITDNETSLEIHISIQHQSAEYVSQAIKQEDCTGSCVNSGTNNFENAGPSNMDPGNCRNVFECPFHKVSTKQHNEKHRHDKKRKYPMCGKKFTRIVWLVKHLNQKHSENLVAQNLSAYECVKSLKPAPATSTPQSLSAVDSSALKAENPIPFFLESSFKYDSSQKKDFSKVIKEPQVDVLPHATINTPLKRKSGLYVCTECGYEAKWKSVLEKHSRVHADIKPFLCQQCTYSSKWKGDLNRHIAKHHGCQLPIKKDISVSKKKTTTSQDVVCSKQKKIIEKSQCAKEFKNDNSKDEKPSDLQTLKADIFQPPPSRRRYLKTSKKGKKKNIKSLKASKFTSKRPKHSLAKRKYFCTFCKFNTRTLSKFHTHIIHHFNKRPFTCSVCGHNSNWKFEIYRHIRLKRDMDEKHRNALVTITNKTGISSSEKYQKYLKVERISKPKSKNKKNGSRTIQKGCLDHSAGPSDIHLSNVAASKVVSKSANATPNSAILLDSVRVNRFPETTMQHLPTQHQKLHRQNNSDKEKTDTSPSFSQNHDEPYFEFSDVSLVKTKQNENVMDMFECRYCPMMSKEKTNVKNHEKCHHFGQSPKSRQFACKLCSYRSASQGSLTKHTTNCHMEVEKDKSSKVETNSFESDSTHIIKSVPSYFCTKCPEVFMTSFELSSHQVHHGFTLLPLPCQNCDYHAEGSEQLAKHVKSHSEAGAKENSINNDEQNLNSGRFACNLSSQDSLTKHTTNCHMEVEKDKSSKVETNSFESDSTHIIKSVPSYFCTKCPEVFMTSFELSSHQVHHGFTLLPLPCQNCDYHAEGSEQLAKHVKSHSEAGAKENSINNDEQNLNSGRFACNLSSQDSLTKHTTNCHMEVEKDKSSKVETNSFESSSTHIIKSVPSYFCTKCPEVFMTSFELSSHQVHHGFTLLPLPCQNCDYHAEGSEQLAKHVKSHSEAGAKENSINNDEQNLNSGRFACNLSSQDSLTKHTTNCHMEVEKDKSSKVETNSFESSSTHIVKSMPSYFCTKCPEVFMTSSELLRHGTYHGTTILPLRCQNCDYHARGREQLAKHMKSHSETSASQRNASFSSYNNGDDICVPNLRSRTKKKRASCTKHPEILKNSSKLSSHYEEVTVSSFNCPHCNYCAKSAAQLTNHAKMHSIICVLKQPASCNNVRSQILHSRKKAANPPRSFTKMDQMLLLELAEVEKALRKPENKGQKKCLFCPAAFFINGVLEFHLSLHGSSGEFKCSHCNYATMHSDNLAAHVKVHSQPVKRFTCSKCPAIFVNKERLKHHFNSHGQGKSCACKHEHCIHCTHCAASLTKHRPIHDKAEATFESCEETDLNLFARSEIFEKLENFEISYDTPDGKKVVFEDKGMEVNLSERFFPPLENDELISSWSEGSSAENNTVDVIFDDMERAVDNHSVVLFEKNKENMEKRDERHEDSQIDFTISSDTTLPEEYLPKVILTDIFSKKKSPNCQGSILSRIESRQSNKSGYQSKKVNKLEQKKGEQSKGYSSYFQKDGSMPSTSGINTKCSLKLKIKGQSANENTKKKSTYSIFSEKLAPINISNEVCDRGFNVSKVQQFILAEGDPERGLSDNTEIGESSMHVQTDNCSLTKNACDKHNGISECDLGSFQLFHKSLP